MDVVAIILEKYVLIHSERELGFKFILLIESPCHNLPLKVNFMLRALKLPVVNLIIVPVGLVQLLCEELRRVFKLNLHYVVVRLVNLKLKDLAYGALGSESLERLLRQHFLLLLLARLAVPLHRHAHPDVVHGVVAARVHHCEQHFELLACVDFTEESVVVEREISLHPIIGYVIRALHIIQSLVGLFLR